MNYRTVLTLLCAGCCLFAVVNMGAALQTSVSGEPADVVDVDTESLPLSTEQATRLKDALQPGGPDNPDGEGGTTARPASDGDGEGRATRSDGTGTDSERTVPSSSDGSGSSDDGTTGSSGEDGSGLGDPVGGLLALLREWLGRLLVALVVLGVVALAVYKREALLDRFLARRSETADASGGTAPARAPDNEIERAWLEMISRAEVGDDPTATPRERAEAVARAGLRREPVHALTDLFEAVRYGDESPSDDAVRDASAHLRKSTGQSDD